MVADIDANASVMDLQIQTLNMTVMNVTLGNPDLAEDRKNSTVAAIHNVVHMQWKKRHIKIHKTRPKRNKKNAINNMGFEFSEFPKLKNINDHEDDSFSIQMRAGRVQFATYGFRECYFANNWVYVSSERPARSEIGLLNLNIDF